LRIDNWVECTPFAGAQRNAQGALMLTVTYSFVAISAEQDKARGILSRLQQYIQNAWQGLQNVDLAFLDAAFNRLLQFDDYCRNRKVERYLIPALRCATREADALIAELEALSARGAEILYAVGRHLASALEVNSIGASEICHSMELYCRSLSTRLKKEDDLLFPLARRLLSVEEWFSLAAKFLADDAEASGRRRPSAIAPYSTAVEIQSNAGAN
jgi:hemerythrin-like domain-containing protein